jgi:hypothetical protein
VEPTVLPLHCASWKALRRLANVPAVARYPGHVYSVDELTPVFSIVVPCPYQILYPDLNSPDIDRNINQRFMQLVGTHDGDRRCEEMPQRDLYQETQSLCAGDTV